MDHHHPDTHQVQQHDVRDHGPAQVLGDHGVAAIFDHDGLAGIFLDIGQRLGQHLSAVHLVKSHGKGPLFSMFVKYLVIAPRGIDQVR